MKKVLIYSDLEPVLEGVGVDIVDAIINGLSNIQIGPLAKFEKIDASLFRVDNDGAKFGLVNCDNFSLQLILQENDRTERLHFDPVAVASAATLREYEDHAVDLADESSSSMLNVRIGSFFSFDVADTTSGRTVELGSCRVGFLADSEVTTISIHKGHWDIDLSVTGSKIEFATDGLTAAVAVDDPNVTEATLAIGRILPCTRHGTSYFRNGNLHYCALVRIRQDAVIEYEFGAMRFARQAFKAVFAIVPFRVREGKSAFPSELQILAIERTKR